MSSGAAEVYAAGNATQDFLHLSYVAEELGIGFELPFNLQIDNTAAEAFANDTVIKTKLKHIDCRQDWVRILRCSRRGLSGQLEQQHQSNFKVS